MTVGLDELMSSGDGPRHSHKAPRHSHKRRRRRRTTLIVGLLCVALGLGLLGYLGWPY